MKRQTSIAKTERKMNSVLRKLGLDYRVKWQPCESHNHGGINLAERLITIHDKAEDQAWTTLIHEALELKLRPLLSYYRELVNLLIGFIEKHGYIEKERFLKALPTNVFNIVKEAEKAKNENSLGKRL